MMAVSAMSLNRRNFIVGGLALPALARKERTAPRPNLVLIVADGLGSWMLGCGGNREIRTPNIDQLAQSGARFENHFACTPASSPSLATLYSGRVPRQHGIQDFLTPEPIENPPQGQAGPPPSFKNEVMLSDILSGAGYLPEPAGIPGSITHPSRLLVAVGERHHDAASAYHPDYAGRTARA